MSTMQGPYELGKTELHTIKQLRRQVQIFLEQDHLTAETWQNVLLMELLLQIYDKLDDIYAFLPEAT